MKNLFLISLLFLVLLTGSLLAGCTGTQGPPTSTPAPTGTPPGGGKGVPPEVTQFRKDWPLTNKDYSNTRATMDSSIVSGNVRNLRLVWAFNITAAGSFGGASSNPIIHGNTVYFQDTWANIYSLDRETGAVKWKHEYNVTTVVGPNGPGVGWGKVFLTKDPFTVAALNAETGAEVWAKRLSYVNTTGIDIPPQPYDGMVYTSTVPGQGDLFYAGGGVGVIYALDEATGKELWNFSTVDSSDIWGNPEINSGGGCWYSPAIDTRSGTMFWGVANPAPFAGIPGYPNGESRPGPNLYTNSLLALNHKDGSLTWYTQVYPHDLFDYDFQIAPILASGNINGKQQEIVIGAGKMGRVYAFNRTTGAILWAAVVGKHENDQLAALPPGKTRVYPGYLGGVESPMSFADGVVYVPYVDLYVNWTPESSLSTGVKGSLPPESQAFEQGQGGLVAIEVNTGKILWEQKFTSLNVGAATVVNDLVFTATFDGTIHAFRRSNGEEIWTYKAPAGINAWPAVTEDMIIWPCGVGQNRAVIALKLSDIHIPVDTPLKV